MGGWWVHDLYQAGRVTELLSWIFWVILSICLHELGHGWAALWQGDDTPRRLDRMTLNPLVHMGPWSLAAFALIGIAWGVMPTDPSRYRWGRRGHIVVAGAGPATNLLLAAVTLTALGFWIALAPSGGRFHTNVAIFLWTGGWLNVLLAMFNLLPAPPLDGASILGGFSFRMWQLFRHPNAPLVGLVVIVLFFFTPIGGLFFGVGQVGAAIYAGTLSRLLGGPAVWDVVY